MNKKYLLIFIALFYLIIRYGFTHQLEGIKNDYITYYFEAICVVAAIIVTGKDFLKELKFHKSAFYGMAISLITGMGIFKLTGVLGLSSPFTFNNIEILLLLLVVAPILEELIFRWLLWHPIESLTKKPVVSLIVCALLFSYSHFHVLWFVFLLPDDLRYFIYYQTAYTLILGLGCGYYVYRYRSLTGAIAVHFAFNLGFYLAGTI